MTDKYNLNTLPAGLQGLDDCDIGKGLQSILRSRGFFYISLQH